ncbi:MAG: helix-turn-helix domain-containing protein [Oscillospiraceae bacterium]|nr:helix-turn-helix domain-containing protein [Oscillospiraceae bacterium]
MNISTLGSRIKAIRAHHSMTQQDFADRIGISRGGLANYEVDRNEPIDAVIVLICREFGVNETWLRTGEGEMLQPVDRDEEIAAFMGDVMRGESPDFRRRLIAVLAKLDSSEWELLEKMALKLAAECKKEDQA